MAKLKLSDVNKKRVKIVGYLTLSGILGWFSATYIASNPTLSLIFAGAINFVLYSIVEELKGEGYIKLLKK